MTELVRPLVSVCMITYNHEKYIAQAIESVLMQQTDFRYEFVIGEDCSMDGTRDIVRTYRERYPDRICLLLSEHNQGMNTNFVATLTVCRGQYIAVLEGDDYWTDPFKLQKQVRFFEKHPECTICFHKIEIYNQEKDQITGLWPDYDPQIITTIDDLIKFNYIPTVSVMYRNVLIKNLSERFLKLGMGDWPLHIMHAQKGKIGYIDEIMAQYRVHSTGAWNSMSALQQLEVGLNAREFVYSFVSRKTKIILSGVIINYYYRIAQKYFNDKNYFKARFYLVKATAYFSWFGFYREKYKLLNLYLHATFPRLFFFLFSTKHKIIGNIATEVDKTL